MVLAKAHCRVGRKTRVFEGLFQKISLKTGK
jgi:hypothetical protein